MAMPDVRPRSATLDVAVLVERHQVALWRFLRALGSSALEAEELAQDTFVAVLERPFVEIDARATAAYLRTVAKHLLLKRRRAAGRNLVAGVADLETAFVAACEHDGGASYADALRACVASLPERSRELLERHYGAGTSRRDLAATYAMSEDGIKTWLRRVRASLRQCVERKVEL
jgi:RNA polymerase sigma-70 factor (ECF subfamily)